MQTLKDILPADNAIIFAFNDISEELTISTRKDNERTVLGSLQADEVAFDTDAGNGLLRYVAKLYIQEQPDLQLEKGAILYVNRRAYRITGYRAEMGVCDMTLEAR